MKLKVSTDNKGDEKYMAVALVKGGKVDLAKVATDAGLPGLTLGKFGLSWDVNPQAGGAAFDLDRFVIELGADGKPANGDASLIFYNNPRNANGSIELSPDNLTGEGDGYDETGTIKFADVPANVKEIVVCVSVYDYAARRQNFGQVRSAAIDILDGVTNTVLTHTDLEEDLSMATGAVIGRFRREANNSWSFKAMIETYDGGMQAILTEYGINF